MHFCRPPKINCATLLVNSKHPKPFSIEYITWYAFIPYTSITQSAHALIPSPAPPPLPKKKRQKNPIKIPYIYIYSLYKITEISRHTCAWYLSIVLEDTTADLLIFATSLTFGVYIWSRPSTAPLSVIPRTKNINSTMYGNVAVKYTTWNSK